MVETPDRMSGEFGILPDMEVVGSDGDRVGTVKELRNGDFLVNRSMKRDVYVPALAVREIREGIVVLGIPAAQVDDQNWDKPDLMG
jgi:hypothetical protein